MEEYLAHHGILGMRWGIRRYQNPDGTLTEAGQKRLEQKDAKWAKKHYDKIYKKTYKSSKKELSKVVKELNKTKNVYNSNGKLSMNYVNSYNQFLSEIMNKHVGDIRSPSGRTIKFVAKRGEVGVHMALADEGYDISQLKRGVYSSGRIAYRQKHVDTT